MTNDDIQFENVSDCLHVRVLTRYLLLQKESAFQAIAAAVGAQPVRGVFVDVRAVPGPYTFMDYIQLGEMTGRHLTSVPIALLALEAQLDPDRIGKVVACNRGANVETFTDEAAAQTWLQKYLTPAR